MAKVDIIVPCYNYARFLEECVTSVLEQSLEDLRVLIIDDASSDDSLCVAQRLADSDKRVTVIAHPQNWGHISTYNQGIEWASSDYFLLLSADDLLVPGALERAAEIMDADPSVVLTYGQGISWHDQLPFPSIAEQKGYTFERQDLVREMCAIGANLVNTPTAVCRTRTQKTIGGYRASLPHSGDMEMWLRFGAQGPVVRINAVQAIYRQHSSNMSKSHWTEDWSDYPQRKTAFDAFFEEYEDRLPEAQTLQAQANYMVAKSAFWRGIGRLRRGHFNVGLQLIGFSINLNPKLRFGQSLASMLRQTKRLFDKTEQASIDSDRRCGRHGS